MIWRWLIEHLIPGGEDILYGEYMEGYHDARKTGEIVIFNLERKPALTARRVKRRMVDRKGRTQLEWFDYVGWGRPR